MIEAGNVPVRCMERDVHAVDFDREVGRQRPVRNDRPLPHLRRSPDVESAGQRAAERGNGGRETLITPACGQHFDLLPARTVRLCVLCTSTTGDAPDTVTVSSMPPTRICALIGAVKSDSSTMPSRTKVLKPGSVNVTLYVPGRRSSIRYRAVVVCDDGPRLLNQHRACRLDRDARQNGARRIAHDARNGALCEADAWKQ